MGRGRYRDFRRVLEEAGRRLKGRIVWNVNSTAAGGGVAELLHALLPYFVGVGLDARWLVIEADEDFFALTKRIHNSLHGLGRRPLGDEERRIYDEALAPNEEKLATLVSRGDLVVVHDPQPAGLVPPLKRMGAIHLILRGCPRTDWRRSGSYT